MARVAKLAASANESQVDLSAWLSEQAAQGLSRSGLSVSELPLANQAEIIAQVASESLAAAFVLWSHRMTTEYIDRFASEQLRQEVFSDLLSGARLGSTALATALMDNSGAAELPVTFTERGADFIIEGHIPWASNLQDGTLVVFGAREQHGERRGLFAAVVGSEGLEIKRAGELIGLNGTSSGSIRFSNHRVPGYRLLTHDLKGFFAAMRPRFLILQSAFCLGLARASVRAAADSESQSFSELIHQLGVRLESLELDFTQLAGALETFAIKGPEIGPTAFVRLRLEVALLAQEATRIELASVGGKGYFKEHPTSRRVRESLFLSVQAPTEGALRWELQRFN